MRKDVTFSFTLFLPCCPEGALTFIWHGRKIHRLAPLPARWGTLSPSLKLHSENSELHGGMEEEVMGFWCGTDVVQRRCIRRFKCSVTKLSPYFSVVSLARGTQCLQVWMACVFKVANRIGSCLLPLPMLYACKPEAGNLIWAQGFWENRAAALCSEADMVQCIWIQAHGLGCSQLVPENRSSAYWSP